jgi:hypothetical protein
MLYVPFFFLHDIVLMCSQMGAGTAGYSSKGARVWRLEAAGWWLQGGD